MPTATHTVKTRDTELIPELQGYVVRYRAVQTNVHSLVDGFSDADFNWRPQPDRWSVAECLDHLCAIGKLVVPLFDEKVVDARTKGWLSTGPFTYGRIGNWLVRQVGPNSKRKFKAPIQYAPSSNHTQSRLIKAFTELQDEFVERAQRANGIDLARVKIPSPALRLLKLSLGQWFALMAGHQERHFQQAEGVREQLLKQR